MQGDLEALRERSDVEVDEAFVLENPWLLKATLSGGEMQARLGSMVAYQGTSASSGRGRDGGGCSNAR